MTIETQRLLLRELMDSDDEKLYLLDSNADVVKYVGMPVFEDISQTQDLIKIVKEQYKNNGIGRYAVVEKETDTFIGWSGLKILREETNGYKDVYELGYRFLPEYWGKGYATESAKAWLHHGFTEMNIEVIYAYADHRNTASMHTLEKLNFENKGNFEDKEDICTWFELRKENFKL